LTTATNVPDGVTLSSCQFSGQGFDLKGKQAGVRLLPGDHERLSVHFSARIGKFPQSVLASADHSLQITEI
jgi:hypothetical protein